MVARIRNPQARSGVVHWPVLLACAGGVGLAVLAARGLGGLEPVELRAWDQLLHWRSAVVSADAPVRVVHVLVEEADLRRFGHPLPDAVLETLLGGLLDGGATAVGIDLYRDRPIEPGADALRDRVLGDDRVIMVEKLPDARSPGVPAPVYLRGEPAVRRVGFSDLVVDDDGVVRRSLIFAWDEAGRPHASLALQLALRHLADLGEGLGADRARPERLKLGQGWLTPLEANEGGYVGADVRGYQVLLDYAGATTLRPLVTLGDWLDGQAPPDFATGRVVLVGTRAPSVRDDFLTPVGDALGPLGRQGDVNPIGLGVAVHAEATEQLLRVALDGAPLPGPWPRAATVTASLLLALLGAGLAARLRSVWWLASALALLLGGLLAAAVGAAAHAIWVPWPPMALSLVGAGVTGLAAVSQRERAERLSLERLFGRYLPSEVVDHLQRHRAEFLVEGRPRPQRLTETILMIDVDDSSRVAEELDSTAFLDWIDRGLGALAKTAEQQGGLVEYFSGDGLKVDFGVPIASRDPGADARRAIQAALAGARALGRINAQAEALGQPRMRVRMGLHTGETVAGSIGSDRRLQYTTLGEAANLAARVEAFEKESLRSDPARPDCRILVSEATRRHLGEHDPDWEWRLAGSIAARGETQGLRVFELCGAKRPEDGDRPGSAGAGET